MTHVSAWVIIFNNMEIKSIDSYRDGGTVVITTESKCYAIDRRIDSKTKFRLFNGYPMDDNSNLIEVDTLDLPLRHEIMKSLKELDPSVSNFFNEKLIKWLIETELWLLSM